MKILFIYNFSYLIIKRHTNKISNLLNGHSHSKENTAVNNVDSPLLELTWKLEKFKFSKV